LTNRLLHKRKFDVKKTIR